SCTVRARAILLALTACHLRHPPCLLRDPATPEIYTLSLHDALPIFFTSPPKKSLPLIRTLVTASPCAVTLPSLSTSTPCNRFSADRKSTRLNSSHVKSSYAVFCLKKKNHNRIRPTLQSLVVQPEVW